jgi:hypothetical protein
MSPWLLAILIDVVLYIFRQVWYWVPIWGGRAQGRSRPRAPSLKARKRNLSLAGIMGNASPERVQDEGFRRRHERNSSEQSLDLAIDEDPAMPGFSTAAGPVS